MTDTLQQELQASLGNAFTIERELGGGGMSRVFLAEETRFKRQVVIKVLSPELAAGLHADRFEREIGLAASLQQANIVPVITAGEVYGLPWYSMPYVAGESLRARMNAGTLSLEEKIKVLVDVLRALAYAHERGIVHRDIKPDNVLLSEGTAVVTDFGIAKALAVSKATPAPGGALTQMGTSLGTPAYMSPEQAAGDDVDHRADLYAWGVMAYELLGGAHPFADRTTAQQYIAAHISEQPRDLAEVNPALPRGLVRLVQQCLRKAPAERPADARTLVAALEDASREKTVAAPRRSWIPYAVAAVVLVASGVLWSSRADKEPAPTAAAQPAADSGLVRLAVLPFENLGRPEDAYVVDGITDELRAKLSGVPGMRVIARASSNAYRGTTKTPEQIAKELGVQYLLTGTLRSEPGANGLPGRLKVSPELVRVREGAAPEAVWSQSVDEAAGEMFKVQASIAGKVVDAMNVALGGTDRARMVEIPTQKPKANDAFMRGEADWEAGTNGDVAALRRAEARYAEAVKEDSTFMAAWAKLSRVSSILYRDYGKDTVKANLARFAARRAIALAPNRPESRRALGASYIYLDDDSKSALEVYEPVRSQAAGNADLLQGIAAAEAGVGRVEDALRDAKAARALDPRSTAFLAELEIYLIQLRRYDEAARELDRADAIAPRSIRLMEIRGLLAFTRGDTATYRAIVDQGVKVAPQSAYLNVEAWHFRESQRQAKLDYFVRTFGATHPRTMRLRIEMAILKGDSAEARRIAKSLLPALAQKITQEPGDAGLHGTYGVLLALTGQTAEGIKEGELGASLAPWDRNHYDAWLPLYQLATTYLLAGMQDKAIDTLEQILAKPVIMSAGWMRIDPRWTPLRANPRFRKLVGL